MALVQIEVGKELFLFTSHQQWVNKGRSWYANCGIPSGGTISIDSKGRICEIGAHMKRAQDDGAFPVRVYAKR